MEKGRKIMLIYVFFIIGVVCILFWVLLKSRNMELWIASYIKDIFSKNNKNTHRIKNIYVCVADHYEPYFGSATQETARRRVAAWVNGYKNAIKSHVDSNGRHPQHTYFYPEEEYDEWVLNKLSALRDEGLGDVEIHLHHDDDNADNLELTLNKFKELLYLKHNLLRKDNDGNIVYGFIHGNWALDNSRPDGKWCGVDNELDVLIKTQCKYDMTMPSAPSDTQTSTINKVYYAKNQGTCKSHDKGRELKVGIDKYKDELMMIQGPLTLNWKSRKLGVVPRIESSELSYDAPPTKERVGLWESCNISVVDAEEHIFIKLHTHGLEDDNIEMFFNQDGFNTLWTELENKYVNKPGYKLQYVTAWEMYKKIQSITQSKE